MNQPTHVCPFCGSPLEFDCGSAIISGDSMRVAICPSPRCIVDAHLLGAMVRINRSFLLTAAGELLDARSGKPVKIERN